MVRKLMVSSISLLNSLLLALMLFLGSQNLSEKHSINLGSHETKEFPAGFLIGMSIVMGSLSGGLTTILFKQ